MIGLLENIEELDQKLFLVLNQLHSPFFDTVFWYVSKELSWIPLYLFLLYTLIKHFKKEVFWILIALILLITFTDQSSVLLKKTIARYRPTHHLTLKEHVHIVNNYTGGMFSFVSSHAANSFGVAVFLGLLFKRKKIISLLFFLIIWATFVSYSRIYLGVHYPLDIIGGGLIGILGGFCTFRIFIRCRKHIDFKT